MTWDSHALAGRLNSANGDGRTRSRLISIWLALTNRRDDARRQGVEPGCGGEQVTSHEVGRHQ